MTQSELNLEIQDQYKSIVSKDNNYLFRINDGLEGYIDIEDAIKIAFWNSLMNIDGSNTADITVAINGEFNEISIDNSSVKNLCIYGNGNKIVIKNKKISQEIKLLKLIIDGSVNEIIIHEDIEELHVKSKLSPIQIRVAGLNYKKIKINEISLFYKINLLKIEHAECKLITLDTSKEELKNNSNLIISNSRISNLNYRILSINNIEFEKSIFDIIGIYILSNVNQIKLTSTASDSIELGAVNTKSINNHSVSINEIIISNCSKIDNINTLTNSNTYFSIKTWHNLGIFGKNMTGVIQLVNINTLTFSHFSNMGEISFLSSNISNAIMFKESNAGKISFFNCKILGTFYIVNSIIGEMKFTGTNYLDIKYESANSDEMSDSYRQLKYLSSKYGNKEAAGKFRALELNERLQNLKSTRKLNFKKHDFNNMYSFSKKISSEMENISEIFTLYLNKVSNNYGNSWVATIRFLIIYIFIFYGFFLMINGFSLSMTTDGIITYVRNISDFLLPSYMHPTKSKLDMLQFILGQRGDWNKVEWYNKALILWNDIVAFPYILYQFIAAFRRHGAK